MDGPCFQISKITASAMRALAPMQPSFEQKNIVYLLKSPLKLKLAIFIAGVSGYFAQCFGQSLGHNQPENQYVADTNAVLFQWNPSDDAVNYHLQVATDLGFAALVYNDSTLITNEQLVNALAPGTYFWRFKYFNGTVNSAWSETRTFTLIDLAALPALSLWWNPQYGIVTADSAVSQWTDLSGNNNHGLQATNADRPIVQNNALNGYPILKFDGNTQYLKTLPFTLNSPNSIFMVFNKKLSGPDDFIFDGNSGDSYRLGLNASNQYLVYAGNFFVTSDVGPNGYKIFNFRYNAGNSFLRHNFNFLSTVGNPGATNPGGFTLGNYGSFNLSPAFHAYIDVAEVLIINDTVSLAQTNLIEQYFRYKFFPPVNLGPDLIENYSLCAATLQTQPGYVSHTWSTGATADSIIVNNPGTYWVEVVDRMGNISRDSIVVNFNHPLPFSLEDTTICFGNNLLWNSNLGTAGYNLLWSNSTSDSSIYISTAGNYYYSVTDTNGCSTYSDTASITINNFPLASLGNDTSLCAGNWIGLNMSAEPGATYTWNTPSTDSITQVTTTGNYWISATNGLGCIAEDTVLVTILGNAPVASFSASELCQGDSVLFTDASTGFDPIVNWFWDFGDLSGTSGAIANVEHAYPGAGTYPVKLIATTNVGCSDDTTINIVVMSRPIAAYGYLRNCDGGDAKFIDLSASAFGPIVSWFWDFGDPFSTSDTSILQNPNAFYTDAGTFPLSLIVENSNGCRDTFVQNINIMESGTANFTMNKICALEPISFTNTSSIPIPLGYTGYKWYFGTIANDSSMATHPNFTYSIPATYVVSLVTTATNGCKNTYKDTLDLNSFVIASMLLSNDSVCQNVPFNLQDNSVASNTTINAWTWTVDGDTVGSTANVPLNFDTSGNQVITLSITSDDNCAGTTVQNVYVQAPPVASFTTSSVFGNIPFPTTFTFTGTGNINSFAWDFDDGNLGNDSVELHTYQDSGIFQPILIVTDMMGCTDTATATLEIENPNFIFNIDITNLQCIEQNGFITIQADINNFSNFELSSIDMIGWIQESQPILDEWNGTFLIGGIYPYQSPYSVQATGEADICCLKIGSITTEFFDTTLNIIACIPLNSYDFHVFNPFPNPSINASNLQVIVPVDDVIELTIVDASGKTTSTRTINVSAGVNTLSFETYELNAGVYTIGVYYRSESRHVKMIKI